MIKLNLFTISHFAACLLIVSCGNLEKIRKQQIIENSIEQSLAKPVSALSKTALRMTLVSAIKQPVTTARQGIAVATLRSQSLIIDNTPLDMMSLPEVAEIPGTQQFELLLDREGFAERKMGKLTWLVDGKNFFSALDREIANAQKSIHMQFYIFDNDDIAVRYADRLKARSEHVKVRVMFDDFGTATSHLSQRKGKMPKGFEQPKSMKSYLRKDSSVEVRLTLNPWFVTNHTKLLVFDDRIAMMGGMNMGREYYDEWHDLMVKIEGPVVESLAKHFRKTWRRNGFWGEYGLLKPRWNIQPVSEVNGQFALRILTTDAAKSKQDILEASLLAICGAKKAYFYSQPLLCQ